MIDNKEFLLLKIEYYREELIKVGKDKGFDNPKTLLLSQNLDKLILSFQKSF
jgi:hypothetical protein